MKYNSIFKLILPVFCLISLLAATSCSDWTETESLKIVEPDIKTQNPELYAQYLANLKEYKASEHKSVYVWFDNSVKIPASRAHRLVALPDSIDVVALMYPDNLAKWELKEMDEIREQKGTKVIYSIDFEKIKAAYNAKLELASEEEPVSVEFTDFCVTSLENELSLVKKYNYDGICIAYAGKSMLHMENKEKKEYVENEKLFMGVMQDWCRRNSNKHIIFEGNPQNVADKSLFDYCQLILVSGRTATSEDRLTYRFLLAAEEGVPQDRLGMTVSATSLDDLNKIIGYFGNGDLAMKGLANWAQSSHGGIDVAGVGIYNVSTDYYYTSGTYNYTKNVISSINPPLK